MAAAFTTVQVYKGYPPVRGGIEGHIDLLTRLLAERGVCSEVLCAAVPGAPRFEQHEGVRVRRCLAPLTLASSPLPPSLPWRLRRSEADIVHLHFPWPPGELAWVLGGRQRPLVITIHCEAVRQARLVRLLSPLTQRVLRDAAGILVTGPFMRDASFLASHRERVRVVPLGVDTDWFRPDPCARDPLPGVPHPRIIFVGRLRHYKGLPILAAALERLPGAQLIIVGDGPERDALAKALEAHGCRARAHVLGDVENERLLHLYQTADVAVLASTSRAEAFGLSVAEAQSCGLPAVTTEVGTGTAQTVADGISGRVVSPADPDALAAALAWCLDHARSRELRAAARRHAEAHLCARARVAETCALYERSLAEPAHK